MRFWTSDLHFSHQKMLRERSFKNLEKHDKYLIKKWNKQVSPDDEVWILGDLSPLKAVALTPILSELAGVKKLVLGNHDPAHPLFPGWEEEWEAYSSLFPFVGTMAVVRVDGSPVLMSHFPYANSKASKVRFPDYRLPRGEKFLLHGHTHSSERTGTPGTLHVGWDAWGRLVTEGEVTKAVAAWQAARES